jgi:hypothetical protein
MMKCATCIEHWQHVASLIAIRTNAKCFLSSTEKGKEPFPFSFLSRLFFNPITTMKLFIVTTPDYQMYYMASASHHIKKKETSDCNERPLTGMNKSTGLPKSGQGIMQELPFRYR